MGAKLASRNSGMVQKEVVALTDEQMIALVWSNTAAKLPVFNSEYIAAVLRAFDALVTSTQAGNLVSEEAIAKIEELRRERNSAIQEATDLREALVACQQDAIALESAKKNLHDIIARQEQAIALHTDVQ